MPSPTLQPLAIYYGLRLDASDEFVQGYVDGMRLDQRGQGVACGRGWIPRSKKCSRDKASQTSKEAKAKTVEKAKARGKLKSEVKAAKGQKARVKEMDLKPATLTGSEKQVKWAGDIRAKKLEPIKAIFAQNQGLAADSQKAMQSIMDESDSKFWIDNRDTPAWALAIYGTRKTGQNQWTMDKSAPYQAEMSAKTNGVVTSRETLNYQVSATRFPKPLNTKAAQSVKVVESYDGNLRFSSKDDIAENERATPLIRALPPGSMANGDIRFVAGRVGPRGVELAPVFRPNI